MRHLARVHPASAQGRADGEELTRFCTHCASLFDTPPTSAGEPHRGRVCAKCGFGVVLTCSSATLTAPGGAFLVVTADLRVSAASRPAEELLAIPDGSWGRPLLSIITSPDGVGELAQMVMRAAGGSLHPMTIPVEAASTKSKLGSLDARVGACGNPPAALVVLERATG